MGAKDLIAEIKRNHYTNINKENETENKNRECKETEKKQTENDVKTKKRTRRSKIEKIANDVSGIFTVTIVGGIGLPGYPLNEGEKLAIAKLTPIKIGT